MVEPLGLVGNGVHKRDRVPEVTPLRDEHQLIALAPPGALRKCRFDRRVVEQRHSSMLLRVARVAARMCGRRESPDRHTRPPDDITPDASDRLS